MKRIEIDKSSVLLIVIIGIFAAMLAFLFVSLRSDAVDLAMKSDRILNVAVIIEKLGKETVQLRSRHWMITNARGEFTEFKGAGVVGEQPVLKPGQSFEYTSGVPLNTTSGMMGGAYQMESESGEHFDIEIPTFCLELPNRSVLLN